MPPEGLESSVDGLGRPVRAVGVVEEREDVRHAAFEGASERDESGASGLFCFNVCSTGSAVFFRSVG